MFNGIFIAALAGLTLLSIALLLARARRRAQQRLLERHGEDGTLLLTDERDLIEIYNHLGVFQNVWAPLFEELLPGERIALSSEDRDALGLKSTSDVLVTRDHRARWFFIPNHTRPGGWLGAFIELEGLPEGLRLFRDRGKDFMGVGVLTLSCEAPELLAPGLAKSWWRELDAITASGVERTMFVNLSPGGALRVGRDYAIRPAGRLTGWTAQRFYTMLEREFEALERLVDATSLRFSLPHDASEDAILSALLESASDTRWPLQTSSPTFPSRLTRQRQILARAILEEQPERAFSSLLDAALLPENEWIRSALTAYDGEHTMGHASARLPLCVAWLARFKMPDHARVERHFVALGQKDLDRFTEIVLGGLSAGEPLIQHHLPRYLERLDAKSQWALLEPWIGARPDHVWGALRDRISPELWALAIDDFPRESVGAAKLITHHEDFDVLLRAHFDALSERQVEKILERLPRRSPETFADLLARVPLEMTSNNLSLATHLLRCVAKLSPETRRAYAEDFEARLTPILSPESPHDQVRLALTLLEEIGGRPALLAIVAFAKTCAKSLHINLESARAIIYERTPNLETGALSVIITDDVQGAITQVDYGGQLAMVEKDADPDDIDLA